MSKFYAVKKGKQTGIFNTWAEAQDQVKGFSGAQFKSFATLDEAKEYMADTTPKFLKIKDVNLDNFDLNVHTDGGCRNHGNKKGQHVQPTDPAAWAFVINGKAIDKQEPGTDGKCGATNNKMEIIAVSEALKRLAELGLNHKKVAFVCDSKYVLQGVSDLKALDAKVNSGKEFPNRDVWEDVDQYLHEFFADDNITWVWTKGHNGENGNEFVDHLLNTTMDRLEKECAKK